ncbi:MAG TPA: amino acid permease [Candidatus Saccharimonadales bacterium]|nr:amino acid permease [Candidatus Saccharimonadales bacterium]
MPTSTEDKISINTAVSIGMKSMIGAGIFSTTSLLGSKIGPAGILSYLLAFAAVWFIAQSFARVAYLYPKEGSFYTYAKQAGGHTLGLMAAGAYLIGLLIAMGLLTKIAAMYVQPFWPELRQVTFLIVALLIALNIFGMKLSSMGIYILLSLTLYAIIMTSALCLSNFNSAHLFPFMPYGFSSVLSGTKVAVFGLFGFESIASLFNIMENPEKNVPKALRRTILYVGIIYFIFISSILTGIPQDVFLSPNITIPQTLYAIFPNYLYLIQTIGIAIFFAILGTIHAMLWSSSQFMQSYFKFLKINCSAKTCVGIGGSVILFTCLTITDIKTFFSLTDTFVLFAFITSIIPLLKLKNEWKSGQNYITVLGLISAFIIFAVAGEGLVKNLITWFH